MCFVKDEKRLMAKCCKGCHEIQGIIVRTLLAITFVIGLIGWAMIVKKIVQYIWENP